jgi:Ribbon-helix-helix protein, copG family
MTERKTDVLNLRVDPALAAEIDRIAAWKGTSASEVARDLIKFGIDVERQLEAQELRRPFGSGEIRRDLERGYLSIRAEWVNYTPQELIEMDEEREQWMSLGNRP